MKRDRTIYRIPTKDEEAQSLWRRVVPVEPDYEAATEMLIVETGMWSKPELFVIAKAHATNIVRAALRGNDGMEEER